MHYAQERELPSMRSIAHGQEGKGDVRVVRVVRVI